MIKVIDSNSWDYGTPAARLVDIHRDGRISADWLIKRAAADAFAHMDVGPVQKDHSRIHLIAMGDADFYGQNRNGDEYWAGPHKVDLPEGDWDKIQLANGEMCKKSDATFTDRTTAGNVEQMHTFLKFAHVYRDHRNQPSKGHPIYGEVAAATHNDQMHRGELLIDVPNSKWETELQKLSSGEDLSFSQSCVLDPSYPVLTIAGYKPIADIVVGDQVWTHAGRWQRVTSLNHRTYTGEAVSVRVNGLPLPLELTGNHPMLAKVFSGSRKVEAMQAKAKRYFKDPAAFEAVPADWTHATHLGEGDRLFYQPVTRFPGFGAIGSDDLAALMGYYLAEGSFGFNGDKACTTQFSCHMADSLPRRVPEIMWRLFPEITCSIKPSRCSLVALVVEIFSTEFSEFLRKYVGRGCRQKQICPEIFNSSTETKLAFLGAWMDGDGCVGKKGGAFASANFRLVLQGRDLLASIGIPASIYHNTTPARKIRADRDHISPATEWWALNINHLNLWQLAPYSAKVAAYPVPTNLGKAKSACLRPCPDGKYTYRIKSVTRRFVSDAPTYNFEVEGDESYSLAGLISHNCRVPIDVCSVCGHKSTKRSEYCKHAAHELTQLRKSGHQVAVVNERPVYFDISLVHRPADRIAMSLAKVASIGEIIDPGHTFDATPDIWVLAASQTGSTADRLRYLGKAASIEKQIPWDGKLRKLAPGVKSKPPESLLDTVTGKHVKSAELFRALADRSVLLPMRHFSLAILGKEASAKLAGSIHLAENALPGFLSRLATDEQADQVASNRAYDTADRVSDGACIKVAQALAPALSLDPEPLRHRQMAGVLAGESDLSPLIKVSAILDPAAEGLLREYAAYELAFFDRVARTQGQDLGRVMELSVLQNACV